MSISTLNLVQLNMGRSAAVSDQLLHYCQENSVDIALVQEPYTNRGRLTGFGVAPIRSYLCKGTHRRGRREYLDHGSAIIVFNPDLVVVPRESGTIENFTSLDLDCGEDGTLTLISGYFKYRVPTAFHVTILEGLLLQIPDKVLVSLDANAFSKRWFSRINDARGETLNACIDAHALEIANVRSPHTTFCGPRGQTNIDVTLVDRAMRQKLTGWSVLPGITSSDHQLIKFTVEQRQHYERFLHAYETLADLRTTEQFDADRNADGLNEDVTAAAAVAHAPRLARRRKVTPPWWTKELQDARKAVRAAARNMSVTGDRRLFNIRRNAYTSLLRKNKIRSWRTFCTTGGEQPWGKLYRWLKNANKKQNTLGLMMRPDGTRCQTIDESVTLLLNVLIPNDPQQQEPNEIARTVCDLQPMDEEGTRDCAWAISPNRAPGIDGITGRTIRVLWPSLSARILRLINICLREARFPAIWKSAVVVPLIKGEDRDAGEPKSYRPVSLLPVMGKILEKVMNLRLQEQISPYLTGKQYGFTKGKSTLDAVENLRTFSIAWNDGSWMGNKTVQPYHSISWGLSAQSRFWYKVLGSCDKFKGNDKQTRVITEKGLNRYHRSI